MTRYQFDKAMRILDHAIESLGTTKSCGLLIADGRMSLLPASDSPKDTARMILADAMCKIVREYNDQKEGTR